MLTFSNAQETRRNFGQRQGDEALTPFRAQPHPAVGDDDVRRCRGWELPEAAVLLLR